MGQNILNPVFVLRISIEKSATDNHTTLIRCILEDPFSKARRGFTSPENLVAFLNDLWLDKSPESR